MDIFDRVKQLAEQSREAPVPAVDVRARVRATLREAAAEDAVLIDRPSLAFASASVALTAVLFASSLSSVRLLWDPWLAFMNGGWTF